MGFLDEIKSESKKYGAGGGEYFNFKDHGKGVYRLRILATPKVVATHFFGPGQPAVVCTGIDEGCKFHGETDKKPSIKLCTYVLDRLDGKVKMAELPLSISYALNDLQEDSDFAFTEFPMDYDIKVTYDPDNSDPKAIYRLTPSPTKSPLTDEEQKDLDEKMAKMTPEQYVEKKKNKVAPVQPSKLEYPEDNGEEIPF